MVRIILGVIGGFVAWFVAIILGEQVLSLLLPEGFGVHQQAFQAAIEEGSPFTANTTHLALHCGLCFIGTALAGFLAAIIAGENRRAPLVLGLLLFAVGLLKAGISWSLVPLWYHGLFTGILAPMAIVGGKLKANVPDPKIDTPAPAE
jgi:hypothetical protein